jgi:hypothetical protein
LSWTLNWASSGSGAICRMAKYIATLVDLIARHRKRGDTWLIAIIRQDKPLAYSVAH